MKVGLAQIECSVKDVGANCAKLRHFSRLASEQGCAVVLFPEMTDTGYVSEIMADNGSAWDALPFQTACQAALDGKLYVICGLSERQGSQLFNSLAVISPAGKLLGRYRKTHLLALDPIHEERIFSPGAEIVQLPIRNLLWGFTICYDLRFLELYRLLVLRGTNVFVNCSGWPRVREQHWDILTRARAIENQAYFIGVNRVGCDKGVHFCGRSRIIDPFGEIVAEATAAREELLVGTIEPEKIRHSRTTLPVFAARRSDLYGDLGKNSGL